MGAQTMRHPPRPGGSIWKDALLAVPRIVPLLIVVGCAVHSLSAQDPFHRTTNFLRDRSKSSPAFLRSFASVTRATGDSVVRLAINGKEAALATVISSDGLVLSKASELGTNTIQCQLSDGTVVPAEVLAVDDDNDLALLQIQATALKPIVWETEPVAIGQWAITPGANATPAAVGIVSTAPRKILPHRAYIGVQLDSRAMKARILQIVPGLSADKAGLKAGDVILSLEHVEVTDSGDLVARLGNYREGQTVLLRVQREEKEWDLSMPLVVPKAASRWSRFNRQERMNRLGSDISRRAAGFSMAIQHDSVLEPWQCGGPLLDMAGRAIGINIARAGRVASYALPAAQVQQAIADFMSHAAIPVLHDQN